MVLKRIVVIAFLAIFAVITIAVLSMRTLAHYYRAQFERLSARAALLRVGESNFADADELRRRYKSQALFDDWNCEGASCKLRIVLANSFVDSGSLGAREPRRTINYRALRRIGIRPAMVVVDISVDNQVVQEVAFAATYQTPRGDWLWGGWNVVKELPLAVKCDLFALQRHRGYAVSSGHTEPLLPRGPFVHATFQSEISESDRSRCQRIRFACMTSLYDCIQDPNLGAELFMPLIDEDIRADRLLRNAIPSYSRIVDDCFSERPFRK